MDEKRPVVQPDKHYEQFVEHGVSAKIEPYLKPALEACRDEITDILRRPVSELPADCDAVFPGDTDKIKVDIEVFFEKLGGSWRDRPPLL